jgi:magnesium chelatase subunit D
MEPTADGPRSPRAAEGRTGSAGAGRGNSAAREQNETAQPLDHPAPLLAMPRGVSGRAGRGRAESNSDRGRYVRAVQDDPGHGTIAVDATLRAAAPFQSVRRSAGRVKILGQDLRFKQFRRKSGIEIVIALDASGSMAANRIRQAKGAVLRLLRDAYIHRDLVALVGFRGDRAEVLMPPGRSVDLACRALDELPVGGGTPLAAGVLTALGLVRRAVRPVLVVLFTDGRPNVPLSGEPVWAELERVCKAARASRGAWMIIDTSRGGRASADAQTLSAMLNARWVPLSRGEPGPIYDSVARSAAGMRHG